MSIMTKNSLNHETQTAEPYCTLCGSAVLALRDATDSHGVEWHHAAGHSSGRERISFFPKDREEMKKIDRLVEAVDLQKEEEKAERAALKAKKLPTSKAALWRHLEKTGAKDKGFGSVEYKIGKYGYFLCSYGEPDGTFYYDSEEIAEVAYEKF